MKLKAFGGVLFLLCALCPAQTPGLEAIRSKTQERIASIIQAQPGFVGAAVIDLRTGEEWVFNDEVFPQGSSIKIPLLMEVYRQAAEGKFRLTDPLPVGASQQVGGSGVLVHLGDGTSQLSVRDLAVLMIVLSDNTATNMLIDLVGMENVNSLMHSAGFARTRLSRKMMDDEAKVRGEENLSTPMDAARIMQALAMKKVLRPEDCDDILSILRIWKSGSIRRGLPPGIDVAFKPGGMPGVATEWAIVELEERPYILIVMGNYGIEDEAQQAMTEISRVVYDYFKRIGRATSHGTYVDPKLLR